MASEAVVVKGKVVGISIKVETNGSGGAKNVLTQEEIDACDGIIIAADKNVEMARFDGKPVIKVKVSDGIHKSQELIVRAVNGDGPIYIIMKAVRQQALLPKERKAMDVRFIYI